MRGQYIFYNVYWPIIGQMHCMTAPYDASQIRLFNVNMTVMGFYLNLYLNRNGDVVEETGPPLEGTSCGDGGAK